MFDYEKIPLHWVNRLSFLTRKILTSRFQAAGLSISAEEWALLLILWRRGGQTPSELAELTFRDRTTITRLVDTMVKKDLVVRYSDPKDRRRVLIDVSEKGSSLKAELIPIAQVSIDDAMEGIAPEDVDITIKTLRKMTQNLLPQDDDIKHQRSQK